MSNTTPSSVSSLDALKTSLKARLTPKPDETKAVSHVGGGFTAYPIPMGVSGYADIEAADTGYFKEIVDWPAEEQHKFRLLKRNSAYIKHGILLKKDDGTFFRPDDELVNDIVNGPWEAENRILIDSIKIFNPPREVLVNEYRVANGVTRLTLVLFRILEQAGHLKQLRDWLLADPESDEAIALAGDLRKWEEAMMPFEAMLDAPDAAQGFGIGVYERMEAARQEYQEQKAGE